MSKGHYTIVVFWPLWKIWWSLMNDIIPRKFHFHFAVWGSWGIDGIKLGPSKILIKNIFTIFRLEVTNLQMQCCQTKDVYSPGDPGQSWVGQSWKLPPTPSSWWLHHFSGSGDFCCDVFYTKRFKVKSKNLVFTPHCNALDIVSVIEIQSTKLKWK